MFIHEDPHSSALGAKESESGKRLSLAVEQLDALIDRVRHLGDLANQPISKTTQPVRLPGTT